MLPYLEARHAPTKTKGKPREKPRSFFIGKTGKTSEITSYKNSWLKGKQQSYSCIFASSGLNWVPPKTSQASRHYATEGWKRRLQLGSFYAEVHFCQSITIIDRGHVYNIEDLPPLTGHSENSMRSSRVAFRAESSCYKESNPCDISFGL